MTKNFWENVHEVSLIGLVVSGVGILVYHMIALLSPSLLASDHVTLTILALFTSSCALVDKSLTKLELLESIPIKLPTAEDAEIQRQAEQEVDDYLKGLSEVPD